MTIKLDAMDRRFYDLMKGVKSQLDNAVTLGNIGEDGTLVEYSHRGVTGGLTPRNIAPRDLYTGAVVPFDSVGKDGDIFAMFNYTTLEKIEDRRWRGIASNNNAYTVMIANDGTIVAASSAFNDPWLPVANFDGILAGVATTSDRTIEDLVKYVAIAQHGEVYTSDNGLDWTEQPNRMDDGVHWNAITQGRDRFVAISSGVINGGWASNVAHVSYDHGVTWGLGTLPSSELWEDIAYGNLKFVAVSPGSFAVSSDGVNWDAVLPPTTENWRAVGWGNGKFIAIAKNSKNMAFSLDGITWDVRSMPFHGDWNSITYIPDCRMWVATAGRADSVALSVDGIDWFEQTTPGQAQWNRVGWVNDYIIYHGYDSDMLAVQPMQPLRDSAALFVVENWDNPPPPPTPPVRPEGRPEQFEPGSHCKAPSRELNKLAMWFKPIELEFLSTDIVLEWNSIDGDVIGELVNPPRGATSVIVQKENQFHTVIITTSTAELSTLNASGGYRAMLLKDNCSPITGSELLDSSNFDNAAGILTLPVFENMELFGNDREYCLNIYR